VTWHAPAGLSSGDASGDATAESTEEADGVGPGELAEEVLESDEQRFLRELEKHARWRR